MIAPLSAKQEREWAKHHAKEARETKKIENEESRKQELHEIKMQEAAVKAGQGVAHKEELHNLKVKELGGPLSGKRMNREKMGLPSNNPLAGAEVFHRGQHMLPKGTDTVPAMLTPGEAVIPKAAAQDPKNKPLIKQMVQQGRQAQYHAQGTTGIVQQQNLIPILPKVAPKRNPKGYAEGTESVPNLNNYYHTDSAASMEDGTTQVEPQYYKDGVTSVEDNELQAQNDRRAMAVAGANSMAIPAAAADVLVGGPVNAISAGTEWLANAVGVPRIGRALGIYDNDVNSVTLPRIGSGTATPYYDKVRQTVNENQPVASQPKPVPVAEVSAPTAVTPVAVPKAEVVNPAVPAVSSSPLTIAERNFNPGNLKFAKQEGAELGEGGFAKFKSHEEGRAALEAQIALDTQKRGMTLIDTMKKYAPASDRNNPEAYANTIAAELGIKPTDKVPADKLGLMADIITRVESGGKYRAQGPELPPKVEVKPTTEIVPTATVPTPQVVSNALKGQQDAVNKAFDASKGDDRTFLETFKDIFSYKGLKDALGLNNQDVARMGAMYLGSRARGYDGARSLSFAGRTTFENSLHRQDREEQFKNSMALQDRADARQVNMLNEQHRRTIEAKLIEAGYPQEAIDKYFKTNDARQLGEPTRTTVRVGESRTMMSTDPALYNKPIVVHTVEEKTGKRKGDRYEVATIDGREVPLDALQKQGLSLTPWSESTHGVTGKTERQIKNTKFASEVADEILTAELGADNVKGKANPNRQGIPGPKQITDQAGSYFSNIGFNLEDGRQMQEARLLMGNATKDMLAAKNAGTKINSIEPYLARNVITQRMGIDPNALMLEKDKPMPAEKIVDLNNLARRFSAVSNDGKPNEAQATSEIQRLHQVWANPKSAKLREQFKGTSNETAFYQFATEALRKSLEK